MDVARLIVKDAFYAADLASIMQGKPLGEGVSRSVFAYAPDPQKWVVKVCQPNAYNQNHSEWELWHHCDVYGLDVREFLAPCLWLSDGGSFMIQRRTRPLSWEQIPRMVPAFLNQDIKAANWGMLGGRPVCHDYALNKAVSRGITKRMVKAKIFEG